MELLKIRIVTLLLLATVTAAGAEELRSATVTGRVAAKSGAPMAEAYVYIFNDALGPPPSPNKYWRLPDEITQADQNGQFTAHLPYGTYYLGAIKRINGKDVGPPVAGDIFLNSTNEQGTIRKYLFNKERIDIGLIDQGQPYSPEPVAKLEGITGIEGKVVNADGKPAEGVSVFAYTSPKMIGRPLFTSDRTGPDGRFLLRVAKGGNYYLRARDGYGGGPPKQAGGGIDRPAHIESPAATVAQGQIIKGIRLVVSPLAELGSENQDFLQPAPPKSLRAKPVK